MAGLGWSTKALLLCCWLQISIVTNEPLTSLDTLLQVPPSHGDVKLMCNGLVMIYMGPDGGAGVPAHIMPGLWGTLSTYSRPLPPIGKTLCRQLGYNYGTTGKLVLGKNVTSCANGTPSFDLTHYHTLLANISCHDGPKNHILRCAHNSSQENYDHSSDVYLRCGAHSTHSPWADYPQAYFGQVTLTPPTLMLNYNASRSSGVMIFKWSGWNFIHMDSSLDRRVLDTICRAMGFTHALLNSVMTIDRAGRVYNETYDQSEFSRGLPSSTIDCLQSCQCIGCCLGPPAYSVLGPATYSGPASEHPDGYQPNYSDALILRCTFSEEVMNASTGGSEDICKIETSSSGHTVRNPEVCPSEMVNIKLEYFVAICVAPTCFFGLLIIGIFTAPRAYRKVRGCRHRQEPQYQVVEENN